MKTVNSLTITLAAAAAITATGCGFGGGGGGGGSRSLAAGAQVGAITSALPASTRSGTYTFDPLYQPSTVEGGSVSAMADTGAGILVAEAPFSTMNLVDTNGAGTTEGTFFFDANSIVDDAGIWATTGNRQGTGAGDLWVRTNRTWSLDYDTSSNELVAAVVSNTTLYVAHGTQGDAMTVEHNGSGAFATVATIQSAVPTAAISYKDELWIGAADSDLQGGNARLYYGVDQFTEITNLPIRKVGTDVRQQVTDMMVVSVAAVASGSSAQDFLVLAVGAFSMNTGQALAGEVMISDGKSFEVLANYNNSAPLALAWADNTIYVGNSNGDLSFRNDDGTWGTETNVGLQSVSSLIVNNAGELVVGGTDTVGAAVQLRTGGGGGGGVTQRFFTTDIAPLLAADCASCHDGTLPAASAVYALASPADPVADNTETQLEVDTTTPASSQLLLKASADSSVGGHIGGEVWAASSASYAIVLDWITQGANYEPVTNGGGGGGTPLPTTFVDIHTFLSADCGGCHGGGQNNFTANNDIDVSYNSAITKINAGTPEASILLTKPAGTAHGGGMIALYGTGQAKYNLVLKWIADGTLRQ